MFRLYIIWRLLLVMALFAITVLVPVSRLVAVSMVDEDDPAAENWETEVFSEQAGDQLRRLAGLIGERAKIKNANLRHLVTENFACGPLVPDDPRQVFQHSRLVVRRAELPKNSTQVRFRGVDGFVTALHDLTSSMEDATQVRVKFKIYRVQQKTKLMATRQLLSISGLGPKGRFEQHSIWDCYWRDDGDQANTPPRLRAIFLRDYEIVQKGSDGLPLLADCTEAVLSDNDCFREQLLYGTLHWMSHLQSVMGSDITGPYGLAIGDVNGDGLDDIYLCQAGGLPNRLFVQNHDGTASDQSRLAGVDWLDYTSSALFVDLDNDGDQDLVLGAGHALLMMSNDGTGKFQLRSSITEVSHAFSLSAADYDDDGNLDIYACRYNPRQVSWKTAPEPVPYHDAENGGTNYLLRNNGGWRFQEVTEVAGLDVDNRRWSFAASWEDFDNDGDVDLYVANDFGRNCLYRNDDGHFMNVAGEAGVEDIASGMSACWGDYDRNGWMDLYVGNMFSSAGGRITFQRRFQENHSTPTAGHYQRMARGNTLFANSGDGGFADVSIGAGVNMGRWAWGSIFVDLNNDGWEDLVVANGYLTAENADDL